MENSYQSAPRRSLVDMARLAERAAKSHQSTRTLFPFALDAQAWQQKIDSFGGIYRLPAVFQSAMKAFEPPIVQWSRSGVEKSRIVGAHGMLDLIGTAASSYQSGLWNQPKLDRALIGFRQLQPLPNWQHLNTPDSRLTGMMKTPRLVSEYLAQNIGYQKAEYSLVIPTEPGAEDAEELLVRPATIITDSKKIREVMKEIYRDHKKMYSMPPRDFEKMIAELMWDRGFEIELTKQTRDGGRDIIALNRAGGFSQKFLVECKRNGPNRPIGVGIVRSFFDVITTEGANKGIIFTSSYFSKDARLRRDRQPWLLDFQDHDDIIEWVSNYLFGA